MPLEKWPVVALIEALAALSLFLFGLYYGSKGLRRLAGNRLRQVIFSLTANRFLGTLVGIGVTTIFQSSSATISLLIGLASSGLVDLSQCLGIILGADIGTTITVQLLAFRLFDYGLLITIVGFGLMNFWPRLRDWGQAVFGFGLVFHSIRMVMSAAEPMNSLPQVQTAVRAAAGIPWLALVFAVLLTALVRSSAATIGLVVGLSFTGLVELRSAIPFILGANLGTTVNAIIASWRGSAEAKRIAASHVLFKFIVVIICLPFLEPLVRLCAFTARDLPRQIANSHTIINLLAALLFLPLLGPLEKLLRRLVPDFQASIGYLDRTALEAPELAVAQATREVLRLGDVCLAMFRKALPVFLEGDKEGRRAIISQDDQADEIAEGITGFLARLPQEGASAQVSRRAMALFSITHELEHIGDVVSKNLMNYCRKKINENLAFSEEGLADLSQFHREVEESLVTALATIATWDRMLAQRLAQKKDWGVLRQREFYNRHLERLSQGLKPTIDTSTIHVDFLADLERINFHCAQIGAAVADAAEQ
ncbi:MAG: Na/Pi cotransporter family protein [candidate division WOR-3 bacterium]